MSEQEYMDADYEVISMVNKGRGTGGELPSKVARSIPEERADKVIALDARIQKLHEAMPLIVTGIIVIAFVIGLSF